MLSESASRSPEKGQDSKPENTHIPVPDSSGAAIVHDHQVRGTSLISNARIRREGSC